ncbi:peptidoglycan recognition protein family protein [Bacillus subtilis]|uniref:peptidoglycan recognition protein family protein n=1 Tax=Bacillus subtilis TaxID=1423 RepID=UPI000DC232AD|nr:N-acetylmuramoyl-L-alanine amidase family protein [Bacillus subtilis]AYK63034.1 N-acetylmuramoyl-L-alanine amidase family protein [Bacillus subtilis subsp. subtilis]MDI6587269.1 N-acetylmuramoyl-L-alanine amidase family protein [Bacillus subtilis]MDM5457925.1 N-acetylmuramoyl-L-alanine amidase family protein [Bacillus subtilis]NEX10678.1 N-acetylmuramoyl-L-alanine amidase family protein [Bacillus subtilis]QGI05182.1 N-acetylmuramoyl-L-alanine amidase family protein [Bacillus subtilis]
MTIQARQMLVPSSKYTIKCPYAMTAEYITFHNTANDASANNEISYMRNNNATVSYHFAVDDKEVVQGLPTNRNAWHCGDGDHGTGNRKSIGVEVCYSKSGGERYRKAEALAIKFIAQLLKERGWGVDRVKKHQDWSGKYCPHRVLDKGRWNAVKSAIAAELKALGGNTSSSSSKPTKVVKINGSYVKNTVIADSLNVRTQRNANSSIILTLPKGSTVQYQKGSTQNGWGYIKYTNSKGATFSGYVNVKYIKSDAELGQSAPKPKSTSKPNSSGIKSVGKIKVVGVKSAAIVMDRPDKNKAKNLGTVDLGDTVSISGSVKGSNNAKGYWEVIYKGKRGYISGQFGSKI